MAHKVSRLGKQIFGILAKYANMILGPSANVLRTGRTRYKDIHVTTPRIPLSEVVPIVRIYYRLPLIL